MEMAINSAHGLAFHRGLGESLYPASATPYKKYLDVDSLSEFAASAYAKPTFSIVANGADHGELGKWVNEFFSDVPSQAAYPLKAEQSKYYGGEERIAHAKEGKTDRAEHKSVTAKRKEKKDAQGKSTTNKEKARKKNFLMTLGKAKSKNKRSLVQTRAVLKAHQERAKRGGRRGNTGN